MFNESLKEVTTENILKLESLQIERNKNGRGCGLYYILFMNANKITCEIGVFLGREDGWHNIETSKIFDPFEYDFYIIMNELQQSAP
jgi:hypothetical protein